jgi:glycine oxidase
VKTFDVAIVGAGVIGASIAFELAGEKIGVVLLDRQQPGRAASWAAAGMLSPAPHSPNDIPLVPLGRESLRLYPDFVRGVEEASGHSIDYRRAGTLQIFHGPHGQQERDKMIAEHQGLGLTAEPISLESAHELEPSLGLNAAAAAALPDEGMLDPRLLMGALLAGGQARGVQIRPNSGVTSLCLHREKCTGVVAGTERISAEYVVIAAGCFSRAVGNESAGRSVCIPTNPVRGQMLALRPPHLKLGRILRSDRGYLVPRMEGRILAGSTLENAGFENCVTAAGVQRILEATLELCPGLADAEILDTWAGLRPGSPDDLPILGPTEIGGLIVATGHYRNGILLAPVTAKLTRDWIVRGQVSFGAKVFSPLRFR